MWLPSVLLLGGCPGFGKLSLDPGGATVPDSPTYDEHVGEILDAYCIKCHLSPPQNGAPDYFRLDQYGPDGDLAGAGEMAELIGIRAGGENQTMPPTGNPAPTQVERDTIAAWVADGAPESPPGTSDTADTGDTSSGGY